MFKVYSNSEDVCYLFAKKNQIKEQSKLINGLDERIKAETERLMAYREVFMIWRTIRGLI